MTSGEVEASKPDADIVAAALWKLGVPDSAALMIGDTRFDAEVAQKAGVRCVLLSSGDTPAFWVRCMMIRQRF